MSSPHPSLPSPHPGPRTPPRSDDTQPAPESGQPLLPARSPRSVRPLLPVLLAPTSYLSSAARAAAPRAAASPEPPQPQPSYRSELCCSECSSPLESSRGADSSRRSLEELSPRSVLEPSRSSFREILRSILSVRIPSSYPKTCPPTLPMGPRTLVFKFESAFSRTILVLSS
jgi:hypothetical protein